MQNEKILIYSILLFALCSCDNFLEEDPRGKLTPSSFFSSPEDLDMAITGMYNKYYQTNARVFRAIYVWCADDVTAHSGGNKSRFRNMTGLISTREIQIFLKCINSIIRQSKLAIM